MENNCDRCGRKADFVLGNPIINIFCKKCLKITGNDKYKKQLRRIEDL